jgi:hypothetical protein
VITENVQEALGLAKFIASSKLTSQLHYASTDLCLGNIYMIVMLRYTVQDATSNSKRRMIW